MLDERLLKEENEALQGEDIYDIHEIFEDMESCIKFIHMKTGISKSELLNKFEKESNEYLFINNLEDYYNVKIEGVNYIGFRTNRFAIVEFY
jgi:hypothetical protein